MHKYISVYKTEKHRNDSKRTCNSAPNSGGSFG